MRKFLGGAVLALGVGGLGLYSNSHNAIDMQSRITAEAARVAETSMHGVTTDVSGRDIRVSGYAASEAEHETILAELDSIDGRRVVLDEIEVLKVVSPYEMGSVKTAGTQTYRGVVSSEAARAVFAEKIGVDAAAGLVLAAGLPDDKWNSFATKGLASLDGLITGEMTLSDHMLTVKGVAATPVEKAAAYAAIGAMPEGYVNDIYITSVLEAADPFEVSSSKTEGGQTYAGYVPSEEARNTLAISMGEAAADLTHAWGAPDDNWTAVASQGLASLDGLLTGEMRLADQMLKVTGVAATPVEKAAAEAKLAQLPDGYTADVEITSKLATAAPFTLRSTKTVEAQVYSGNIPNEEARAGFSPRMGGAADGLELAWGAPDDAWPAVAEQGLGALDALDRGEMALVDRKLTITGVAMTPVEKAKAMEAVAALPQGYTADVDIITIDDGKPVAYTVQYDPVTGATVEGKLTSDMDVAKIAKALGVGTVSGDPVIAPTAKYGTGDALKKQLSVLAEWLPVMEGFSLTTDGGNTDIVTRLRAGVDADLFKGGIAKELGNTATIGVSEASQMPAVGAKRETALFGNEVYQGGFWLPEQDDFAVSAKTCSDKTTQALKTSKIHFLTGSAKLDARSVQAVNNIAGIILRCVSTRNLAVEIGGHTDSDGGLEMNMDLSAARAKSVVDELILRGIPTARITSKGYGPTEPVATNQTNEGKAANRRTTIRWSEVSE